MEVISYPLNNKELLRKKKKIKQLLLDKKIDYITRKVAILGGSTTNEVVDQLDLFLLANGITAIFYQSEYGQY